MAGKPAVGFRTRGDAMFWLDHTEQEYRLWRLSDSEKPIGDHGWPSILELGEITVRYTVPTPQVLFEAESYGLRTSDPSVNTFAKPVAQVVRRYASQLAAFQEAICDNDLQVFCTVYKMQLANLAEGAWCVPALRSLMFWHDAVMAGESQQRRGRSEYPVISRRWFSGRLDLHRAAQRPNEFWRAGTHFLVLKELPLN